MKKDELEEDTVDGVLTCPCCGAAPTITHNSCITGAEATVSCSCGLSLTKWSSYNSYYAEKAAIRAWNKTSKSPRKKVEVVRERD